MLARGVRNVIYNYTDAQRKVRSATSNDAWGPSPALMHEIADLTDNVVAYAEIMPSKFRSLFPIKSDFNDISFATCKNER
jgi:epsin